MPNDSGPVEKGKNLISVRNDPICHIGVKGDSCWNSPGMMNMMLITGYPVRIFAKHMPNVTQLTGCNCFADIS